MSQTIVHGHNLTVKRSCISKKIQRYWPFTISVHFHYLANKREGNIYDSNICYNITASE